MSLSASERETVIVLNDEEDVTHIYTAQRPWITRLRKNASARLLEEGSFEGSAWARFEVPKELVNVRPKRRKGRSGSAAHLHAPRSETPSTEGVIERNEGQAA